MNIKIFLFWIVGLVPVCATQFLNPIVMDNYGRIILPVGTPSPVFTTTVVSQGSFTFQDGFQVTGARCQFSNSGTFTELTDFINSSNPTQAWNIQLDTGGLLYLRAYNSTTNAQGNISFKFQQSGESDAVGLFVAEANMYLLGTGITANSILYVNSGNYIQTLTIGSGLTFSSGTLSITAGAVPGIANNTAATAGTIGESVTSSIASGSATSLTTATAKNVTSISLTAGDWLVTGEVHITYGASSTATQASSGITQTTGTIPTDGTEGYSDVKISLASGINSVPTPSKEMRLSGTTTVYLVASTTFSAGTANGFGTITAVRIR